MHVRKFMTTAVAAAALLAVRLLVGARFGPAPLRGVSVAFADGSGRSGAGGRPALVEVRRKAERAA